MIESGMADTAGSTAMPSDVSVISNEYFGCASKRSDYC